MRTAFAATAPSIANTTRVALMSLAAMLAAMMLFVATPARAADESDLLPVDEAFALSAEAIDARSVKVRWRIADGYYLYRHRISVEANAPARSGRLQLPRGKAHRDEFFGATETYRRELLATLPLIDTGASSVALKIKYQGCADIGICYPPQTRSLTVALPGSSARENAPPEQTGAADTTATDDGDLGALGRVLGGTPESGATTGPANLGNERVPLPEDRAFAVDAIAGDGNTVLLRLTPAKGYYLYRDKIHITGRSEREPLMFGSWSLPKGTPWKDEHFGQVQVYFEQLDLSLPVLRTSDKSLPITIEAAFQGCQTDGICYPPMRRTLALTLPAGATISPVALAFQQTAANANAPNAPNAPASISGSASPPNDTGAAGISDNASARGNIAGRVEGTASPGDAAVDAPLVDGGARGGLLSALLWALIGGLILNLMPCVLPVLSIKVLGLIGSNETPQRMRAHALWYAAGVILSFLALGASVLALRGAGQALGWGFHMQNPLVVAVLALVMFAFGLSLSGVWTLGGRWTGAGQALTERSGAAGDFFTGVLAVVVAAPCTAPFVFQAMGWAFAAPTATALPVFAMLGFGLALPFLAIGFVPALAKWLPKPGAWMETLKQLLAFPLYLTAAWLLWVLTKQLGADAVKWWSLAAIAVAVAAWAYTRARMYSTRWGLPLAALAMLAAVWPLRMLSVAQGVTRDTATASSRGTEPDATFAVPFSEQRLADLRSAGRVVLVNMTADWCVTCKVNEKTVFARDDFQQTLAQANAVYMVGDWTTVDPAITAYLKRYRAVGVPLYVVYPRNGGLGRVLPTVLTPALVRDALAQAATP